MSSAYDDEGLDGLLYPGELMELPGKLLAEGVKHRQEKRQVHALPRLLNSAPKKLTSYDYGRWYDGNYAKRQEAVRMLEESRRRRRPGQKLFGSARQDVCERCSCSATHFPQWDVPGHHGDGMPRRGAYTAASSDGERSRTASVRPGDYGMPLSFTASSSDGGGGSRASRCACACACHAPRRGDRARHGVGRSMPAGTHNPHLSCMKTWLKGASPAETQEALDILNDKLGEKAEQYHSNFFHGPGTQPPHKYNTLSVPMKQYIREQQTLAWKQHQLRPHQNVDELAHPRKTGTFLPPVPVYDERLLGAKAPPNPIKSWYERRGATDGGRGSLAPLAGAARPVPQRGDSIPRQGLKFGGLYHRPSQAWNGEPSNVKSHFLVAQADHLRPIDYSIHPAWGLERIAK